MRSRLGVERLTSRWAARLPTSGISLAMNSLLAAEAIGALGLDSVTIDMQHGALTEGDMMHLLQALGRSDAVPFVRVAWNHPDLIMKALDAGALGLFCPMIESADEAARFVLSCRYPPGGNRSIGPLLAEARFGNGYVADVAASVLPFAMIESEAAVSRINEICSVPGLSGVYVGTSDLSLSLVHNPTFDPGVPALREALVATAAAAHSTGKIAAVHIADVSHAKLMRELGYNHIVLSSDYRIMMKAVAVALDRLLASIGSETESAPVAGN